MSRCRAGTRTCILGDSTDDRLTLYVPVGGRQDVDAAVMDDTVGCTLRTPGVQELVPQAVLEEEEDEHTDQQHVERSAVRHHERE